MCIFVLNQLKAIDGKEGSYFDLLFFINTHVDREQILLPKNFEYVHALNFVYTHIFRCPLFNNHPVHHYSLSSPRRLNSDHVWHFLGICKTITKLYSRAQNSTYG